MTKNEEKLTAKLKKLAEQKKDYEQKHSIHTFKSEFIGCKGCGSKLKVSLIHGESCPLCYTDLRGQTTLDTIKKYNLSMYEIQQELEIEKSPVKRYAKGTSFELDKRTTPDSEAHKKILNFLMKKYGEEFLYANGAESEKYIFVASKDFIHNKTYFSAWYDGFLFDKKGNFIQERRNFMTGDSYSSFFIDNMDYADDMFRIYLRSHIHSGHKQDDEYHAVWSVSVPQIGNTFYTTQNPFIFHERSAERSSTVFNEHFTTTFGDYYTFVDLDNHEAWEVSLDSQLLRKLKEKYLPKHCL